MTRTVLFANAQANATSAGRRSSLVRQVLDSAKAMLATLDSANEAGQSSFWLTPSIGRNMSARARRLMRADY